MKILTVVILLSLIASCNPSQNYSTAAYNDPSRSAKKGKEVEEQIKREWAVDGITVSNKFDGARINGFDKVNDSLYQAIITPEDTSVRMSPWYAFKIKSDKSKRIRVHLKYTQGTHRYFPKYSKDSRIWLPLRNSDYYNKNDSTVLTLNVGEDYQYIAGKELETSSDLLQWMLSLSAYRYIKIEQFGTTIKGRKLKALLIAFQKHQPTIIIISRQHPTEVSGYLAMQEFIEKIASYGELATEFRNKFSVIVVPMLNPDGVDMGHSEFNAMGVDLTNDWFLHTQTEINSFQNYVKRKKQAYDLNIVLAIDFHSTEKDLIYTFKNDKYPSEMSVIKPWIDSMTQYVNSQNIIVNKGDPKLPVSANWFKQEFNAESLIYEVGDEVSRDLIKKKGDKSAEVLMQLLLEKYKEK
ncbi:MAG: M14 family zinc carboxypeptidase [Fulvivirga sp.]|uniref:M14 family zinc carboxypeptidase n=1 Tax=Fulvivirga sp. TaxID=1931237 RepID=UPI0032F06A55